MMVRKEIVDISKVVVVLAMLLFLGGCLYKEEPMPIVSGVYTPVGPAIKPAVPKQPKKPTPSNYSSSVPRDWFPPRRLEKKWTAIVIHHSGSNNGNAAIFGKWHTQGRHWEGVGYDFVIGNGTDSSDGQVEVTFRWHEQKTGAHCGGTPGNWANREAVGICLVGNFNRTGPTARQMNSLAKLVRFLQGRYRISTNRIYGHNTTPGAKPTDCPGRRFSMGRLKSMRAH